MRNKTPRPLAVSSEQDNYGRRRWAEGQGPRKSGATGTAPRPGMRKEVLVYSMDYPLATRLSRAGPAKHLDVDCVWSLDGLKRATPWSFDLVLIDTPLLGALANEPDQSLRQHLLSTPVILLISPEATLPRTALPFPVAGVIDRTKTPAQILEEALAAYGEIVSGPTRGEDGGKTPPEGGTGRRPAS